MGHTEGVEGRGEKVGLARTPWARRPGAACVIVALASGAAAAELDWITEAGGSFNEPKNWSFAFTPRIADLARFGYRDAAYEVTLDASTIADAMEVYRGAVALALLGNTLTLEREDTNSPPGLRVADDAGQTAALGIVGPGRVTAWDVALARAAGSEATLTVSEGARLSLFRDLTIGGSGHATVRVGAGARIAAQSAMLIRGSTIEGVGTLASTLSAGGAISPGTSITGAAAVGALSVQGGALFAPTASLLIDLAPGAAGGAPGGDAPVSDLLFVSGAAALGGEVRVSFLLGYTPTMGDSFTILTAGNVTGQFSGVSAPTLADGLLFSLAYSPTSVTLTVVPSPPAGVALALAALGAPGAPGARRRRPNARAAQR